MTGGDRVENALDHMQEIIIAQDMRTSEQGKAYSRACESYQCALRKLQAATRKLLATGWGPAPIDPALIERAMNVHRPSRKPKRISNFQGMGPFEVFGYISPTEAQEEAVKLAHQLLQRRGLKITTTRGGLWWRLAAILFGNPRADLFQYMRRYSRDAEKSARI